MQLKNPLAIVKSLYWLMRARSFDLCETIYLHLYEYANLRFKTADLVLRTYSSKKHPKSSAARLQAEHEAANGLHASYYGQTPIRVMRRIIQELQIRPDQRILDLGCGTGRLAFWLATQAGLRVYGVDRVPAFYERACAAQKQAGIRESEVTFQLCDCLDAPFEKVDLVYFYGLGLGDALYEKLCRRLKAMKNPPWIITIGGPLKEYDEDFMIFQHFKVAFNWGWTTVYLNVLPVQTSCQLGE